MSSNRSTSNALYLKLRNQFPEVTYTDKNNLSNNIDDAILFDFPFVVNGEKFATVTISLGDPGTLKLIRSEDNLNDRDNSVKKVWFKFLRDMRNFAKSRILNFKPIDPVKGKIQKRDYFKDATMTESSLYGSTRSSYQKLENTKLIIRHSSRIEEDSPNSRTRNISSLFIESENGERFRYPFIHLSGARAMQRHCSNGGSPHDSFGQYIVGLSENIYNLRRFNQLVNRNAFLENTEVSEIAEAARNKTKKLKKTLESIQKQRGYMSIIENFEAFEKNDINDEMLEDLKNRFTLHQFNEELTELFPYITDLLGEGGGTASMGMKNPAEPRNNKLGDPRGNNMSTTDMYEGDNELDSIINNFQQDVEQFRAGGDMSEELFNALYSYYANSGEMPYGVQKGRDGDPMDWIAQQFENDIAQSGTEEYEMDEAGMGHASQEEALHDIEEKIEEMQQQLEREVEWVLSDYYGSKVIHDLISPIQAGFERIKHFTEQQKGIVSNNKELEEAPKKTDPYDASDAADEPVSDYKGKERDPSYELRMVLDQHPKIQIEEFHKEKIRDMLVHTLKQHKAMTQTAQDNPKEKNARYAVEKVEARLKLMKVRYDSATKATNWPTYIQHIANSLHGIDNPAARPLANLATDWDTRTPRGTDLIDKEQKKEAIQLIKQMVANAEILPIFFGNREAAKEGLAFEELENLLKTTNENQRLRTENNYDIVKEFENKLDNIIYEEAGLLSHDPDVREYAIVKLNRMMPEHFPVGNNGTNAIESLDGIIDDPGLNRKLEALSKDSEEQGKACARSTILDWIKENAPNIVNELDLGDLGQEEEPEQDPAVPAPAPAAQAPAPEQDPAAQAPAPEENEDSLDGKLQPKKSFDMKELAQFIHSFYDKENKTFPPGNEGVITKVSKKFGPEAEQLAEKLVSQLAPQQDSEKEKDVHLRALQRIRELASIAGIR